MEFHSKQRVDTAWIGLIWRNYDDFKINFNRTGYVYITILEFSFQTFKKLIWHYGNIATVVLFIDRNAKKILLSNYTFFEGKTYFKMKLSQTDHTNSDSSIHSFSVFSASASAASFILST